MLALFSVWSSRFLPLQDYPQHLFIAFAAATADTPVFDWQNYYSINLRLAPYNLCYLFIAGLAKFVSIEAAGKAFISLILGLYAVFALTQKRSSTGATPWPLVLLFPVFFNQIFYFGFLNYLLALPILLFALRDAERVSKFPLTLAGLAGHVLLVLLVFLTHPFAFVIYLVFGGWVLLFSLPDRAALKRLFFIYVASGLLFVAWYLQLPSPDGPSAFAWASLVEESLPFFLLLFTGMSTAFFESTATLTLWIIILVALSAGAYQLRGQFRFNRLYVALAASALVLFFILPFHFGYYAVFNFRLAPVVYLLVLLLLSAIPLPRANIVVLVIASIALLVIANQRHRDFSDEAVTILPLLEKMQGNASVLPVYIDARSEILDKKFFYQIHSHDHYYYHTLVGGGFSPTLFPNPMLPLQYKPGLPLPDRSSTLFELQYNYDYVLVRRPSRELFNTMKEQLMLLEQSGDWVVFGNPGKAEIKPAKPGH